MLSFCGNTIPAAKRYIHLPFNRYSFKPVPIGDLDFPIQSIPLYNYGSGSVEYDIDTTPIEVVRCTYLLDISRLQLQEENCGFPVLTMLSSSCGVLKPGDCHLIDFIFRPLELKEYNIDLQLRTSENKSYLVSIRGEGVRNPVSSRCMSDDLLFADGSFQ